MNARDVLADVRAAIEADAAAEARMARGEWDYHPIDYGHDDECAFLEAEALLMVDSDDEFLALQRERCTCNRKRVIFGAELIGPADSGAIGDCAGFTDEDAAGIARARNRWPAYLRLAEATAALVAYSDEGAPTSRPRPEWDARFTAVADALAALADEPPA